MSKLYKIISLFSLLLFMFLLSSCVAEHDNFLSNPLIINIRINNNNEVIVKYDDDTFENYGKIETIKDFVFNNDVFEINYLNGKTVYLGKLLGVSYSYGSNYKLELEGSKLLWFENDVSNELIDLKEFYKEDIKDFYNEKISLNIYEQYMMMFSDYNESQNKWIKSLLSKELNLTKEKYHQIKFVDNNNVITKFEIKDGETLTIIDDLTKSGYNFLGWYLDDFKAHSNMIVTSDLTFVAKWEKDFIINLTLDLMYDTDNRYEQVRINKNLLIDFLDTPTRDNYAFLGWYLDKTFEEEVNENNINVPNTTLYAKWIQNPKHNVTLNYNYLGSENRNILVFNNNKVNLGLDPVRKEYEFAGWYLDNSLTKTFDSDSLITKDIELFAKWIKALEYYISFDLNYEGQTELEKIKVYNDRLIELPRDIYRKGYLFAGWYLDKDLENLFLSDTNLSDDITLYAKWKNANTLNVTFDLNYDTLNRLITVLVYEDDNVVVPSISERNNYMFAGWYYDLEYNVSFDEETIIKESIILYAKWLKTVTVTFDYLNDEEFNTFEIIEGEVLLEPKVPTKANYEFVSWTLNDLDYDFNEPIYKDIVLKAKWKFLNVYNINYVIDKEEFSVFDSRHEMIINFLSDFYEYITYYPEKYDLTYISLEDFIGYNKTTNKYEGVYDKYVDLLIIEGYMKININYDYFINHVKFNKWIYLINLIDLYVNTIYNGKHFWNKDIIDISLKAFLNKELLDLNLDEEIEASANKLLNLIPEQYKSPITKFNINDTFELPVLTKNSYEFLGWYDNEEFRGRKIDRVLVGTDKDLTLYPKFQKVKYKIEFRDENRVYETQYLLFGENVEYKGDIPNKLYHIFKDWSDTVYEVNRNKVYTPIYEKIKLPDKYVLASDDDFIYGSVYVGTADYVVIPEYILGSQVKDTYNILNNNKMFQERPDIKGVFFENPTNITSVQYMFENNINEEIELDYLILPNLENMDYMFLNSNIKRAEFNLLDSNKIESMRYIFQGTNIEHVSGINTSNVKYMNDAFRNVNSTTLELIDFETSNITDMYGMFSNFKGLNLDLSSFDTSNVTNMKEMFAKVEIESLDLSSFDTSNITDMYRMFYNFKGLNLDLSSFDTSNVTNMYEMFSEVEVESLDLSSFDTSNVENMTYMFYNFKGLNLDLSSFDTSNVTSMKEMFTKVEIESLDLSSFDTSNITNMRRMFYNFKGLSLNLSSFDTSNVTNMKEMFLDVVVETINLSSFDTSNVEDMTYMFYNFKGLNLDLSSFNVRSLEDMTDMFIYTEVDELIFNTFNNDKIKNTNYLFKSANINILDLSNFRSSSIKDVSYMFENAKISELNLSGFNLKEISVISKLFSNSKIEYINLTNFHENNIENLFGVFSDKTFNKINFSNVELSNMESLSGLFSFSKIEELNMSNLKISNNIDIREMFYRTEITNLNLSNFKSSEVTDVSSMFTGVIIKDLNLSNFNGENITNMNYMFSYSKITSLNLTNFTTSNVEDMSGMFSNSEIESLNLNSFDTSNVTNMRSMFASLKVTNLILNSFNINNVINMDYMFSSTKINSLDLSSFDFNENISIQGMFNGDGIEEVILKEEEDVNYFKTWYWNINFTLK